MRHPQSGATDTLGDYARLVQRLQERVPLAASRYNPFRFFLANGASISLELGGCADLRSALFEIATPECSSPRDVLVYQIANDQLIEEAFAVDHPGSRWALIKSNTDAHGHTLGQHESYDMEIAQGGWLVCWWMGLIALLPLIALYRILGSLWIGFIYLLYGCAWMVARMVVPAARTDGRSLESEGSVSRRDTEVHIHTRMVEYPRLSAWFMHRAAAGLHLFHLPIALLFQSLLRGVALRRQRRDLSAFLASRCILDGAGSVDEDGRFWVSPRAAMVNAGIGFGSYGTRRPVFRCDPLLRDLLSGPYWSFSRYLGLFRRRQRIELAIGDSGMCQWAQYLRCGTTSLVLDLVEMGASHQAPRLKDAVESMRQYARDWMMVRSMRDRRGNEWKALQLQRWYLKRVKEFLEMRSEVPHEAWQIVEAWQTTLNQLVFQPNDPSGIPMALVGRLDWLSKLWLVHQMEPDTAWQVRKKIDIRYHELSEFGYHRKLTELVEIAPVVRDDEIARAKRSPPNFSPARRRGNLIREFSDADCHLEVDWRSARYEVDGRKYRVAF